MNYKYLTIIIVSFFQCFYATAQEKNVFKQNASFGIHWDGLYPSPNDVIVDQDKIKSIDLSEIIPREENAIKSLIVNVDNIVYGATSGKKSHLFAYDKTKARVIYLGRIGSNLSVYHSLVHSKSGDIFIGTTRWTDPSQIKIKTQFPGGWPQSKELVDQSDYDGGHLYLLKKMSHLNSVDFDSPAELIDLGIPFRGEGIYNLTYDSKLNRIYGLTIPSGIAFYYDINTDKIISYGPTTRSNYLPPYTFISRSLVAFNGDVYGSGFHGEVFHIQGRSNKLIKNTGIFLPCLKGRESLNVADILLPSDSIIIGGTSEGYIFSFNPSKNILYNHGRSYRENRIRGMVKGNNERYYFLAGEYPDGFCQLFSFDLKAFSFESLGLIEDVKGNWLGYQFDSMAVDNEGIIYIGENCDRAHLFIYDPN